MALPDSKATKFCTSEGKTTSPFHPCERLHSPAPVNTTRTAMTVPSLTSMSSTTAGRDRHSNLPRFPADIRRTSNNILVGEEVQGVLALGAVRVVVERDQPAEGRDRRVR